jgi:hypothetical protein
MKKTLVVLSLAVALLGATSMVYAKDEGHAGACNESCKRTHRLPKGGKNLHTSNDYTKGQPQVAGEIEKTGVVEVKTYGAYHKIERVTLNCGDESIKLIHSAKHSMRDIEKMNGKTVTVRGKIRPKTRKHPEVAFEVIHLNVVE